VVGGGVLGTMHAVAPGAAVTRSCTWSAKVRPAGASVRNFGLVWRERQAAGAELALALRAGELWAELGGAVAGLPFPGRGIAPLAADEPS